MSRVANMSEMFHLNENVDKEIGTWDISSVTSIQTCYRKQKRFTGTLTLGSFEGQSNDRDILLNKILQSEVVRIAKSQFSLWKSHK